MYKSISKWCISVSDNHIIKYECLRLKENLIINHIHIIYLVPCLHVYGLIFNNLYPEE